MAVLTPGSVVKISGAPIAGEQSVEELTYTGAQIDEAVRLILTPGHLAAQLAEVSSPIITTYGTANVEVNLEGVELLTLKASQDFTFDVPNNRFFYSKSGATGTPFNLQAALSFSQNAASAELIVRATKNGVALDDIYFQRTVGNSNTIGVGTLSGHFTLDENDYIEISVESNKTGDFSAWSFATAIIEEAQ